MKYSEYRSKSKFKGNVAFYIVMGFCLIAIGGASWFAASSIKNRIDKGGTPPESDIVSEYSVPEESSEENLSETSSDEAGKAVSDEPYSSEESVVSEPDIQKTEATVFTLPVQGEIIKKYSEKELQYSATYGDMRLHSGVDIACEEGTSVSAAAEGTVLSVEETGTLGTVVAIDHKNGITAKYAALKDIKVKAGDTVTAGDIIGAVTTVPSECADQSHLHLEVCKNNYPVSPLEVMKLD